MTSSSIIERDHPVGVFYDMPAAVYHASAGVSRSQLLHLKKSPAHFFGNVLNPDRPPPKKSTAAQITGTLMHCALFEPDQFPSRYPIGPDVTTRNSKEWKLFEAGLRRGQTAIKADEAEEARAQARSLLTLPEIAEVMAHGKGEVSVFWHEPVVVDAETGEIEMVLCRARIDWTHLVGDSTSVIIVDGKTCGDSSPEGFAQEIVRHDYDLQDAFYRDGYEKASGLVVEEFIFAQVETEWPYVPGCCFVTPQAVEDARTEYRRLLQLYVQCKRANKWPPYAESIAMVSPRRWKSRNAA